ncbi:hypothetical protein [Nostoc sp.]|uniref:hypothetical protein n=1 Tax=Nostoc sp. TaxID=1180 RepID=UPI002FF6BF84
MLVKQEKSGSPSGNANFCCVEFRHLSALDTLAAPQSPKVGKTEKTEPAVSRRKSPNQRRYKGVRSLL